MLRADLKPQEGFDSQSDECMQLCPYAKSDDMKVEPFRSKIRWADSIECYEADDKLWIIGDLWEEGATDLMNAYEAGDGSPHVRFANSFSDEKLTEFTAIFIVSAADWQPPLWMASAHQPQRSQARRTKHVVESRYVCVP